MEYDKKNRIKKINKAISILKLLLLFMILIGVPVYLYFSHPELISRFTNLDEINKLLSRYETASIFIYMGLQVFQIVVSIIPGQALQFAAGYAYHFWLGYLYSIIGVALGTVVTYYLARLLGKDALHVIFGEEKFSRFVQTINSKRSYIVLFVIFLIPGVPKDLFTYAAGVSEMRIIPFLLLSLIGRTPAMLGSIWMGSMVYKGSYTGPIVLGVVAIILFIAGILNRDKMVQWTDRLYNKMTGKSVGRP